MKVVLRVLFITELSVDLLSIAASDVCKAESVASSPQYATTAAIIGGAVGIRPSVDGLYRDGTVHISREMHKQCFITRREMTSRAPKPHRHRSRTFL